MAFTVTPLGFAGALKLLRDGTLGGTGGGTATLDKNINDGPATVYFITVDNSATAAVIYVKAYNAFTATIGTTDPDLILYIPASKIKTALFITGSVFSTAISATAVTAAGTAGTTNSASAVIVDFGVA
jgi:hypothetical protein